MSFEFVIPSIVDPQGVDGSPHARPMDVFDDTDREQASERTGGEPITDFKGTSNPYIDYESIDLLLSLQHPRSQGYDEMCFIIMGQAKELLFKSLYFELYNARLRVVEDDLVHCFPLLERSKRIIKLISQVWDVLATITPNGFNSFRDYLSVASGQQSFMYRHLEFILGNKNRKMLEVHRNVPHVFPELEKNFNAPSLYDEVIRLLHRREHDIDQIALEREWGSTYQSNKSVERAWYQVYANPRPDHDLYQLAESLVGLDEHISEYRHRHFVTVQRILGYKPGTGGSSGVEWLRKVIDHRFFPELWNIRTDL